MHPQAGNGICSLHTTCCASSIWNSARIIIGGRLLVGRIFPSHTNYPATFFSFPLGGRILGRATGPSFLALPQFCGVPSPVSSEVSSRLDTVSAYHPSSFTIIVVITLRSHSAHTPIASISTERCTSRLPHSNSARASTCSSRATQ